QVVGAIYVARRQPGLFSDTQVQLLKTFADQAVIALENVRLFRETRTSLEQQTATADVLKVISRSAFDLQAVFDTVAESSVRLCRADRAFILRFDGELLRMVVAFNASEEHKKFVEQHPIRPGRNSAAARAALEHRTVHIPDVMADPEYTYEAKDVDVVRTLLSPPLRNGADLLGAMLIYPVEVRHFTDTEIALVEPFADEAGIAIENAGLLDALRQRTEDLTEPPDQQTAPSQVLQVISRSPF